ncbi:MAG: hypothetical protein WC867_06045 [Candidatus Pacearchaeota archaeon]|jgi:hypothetical protein
MESKITFDIGEEIILKLKELNRLLERVVKDKQNEEKLQSQSVNGN